MPDVSMADEEFTELVDADIPRMDLVDKAANGTRFFIAKSSADDSARGLFAPEFVRDLIAKSEPTSQQQETVTMSGSLAAIAAVIHGAPVRKAEPAPGTDVEKADVMADDLDPTTVLAEPDDSAPGEDNTPGSPAWEAIDAATARKWTGIAVRLKNALSVMANREMLEAASGDCDDAGEAWELQDAECALDYVINTLAGFAVGEQAAAELGSEALEAVGKAMSGLDVTGLETLEAFAPVMKAGRTLSAGNEAAIRAAVDSLQKVLASLPAPATDDGQPVAKQTEETTVPETPAATVPAMLTDGEYVLPAAPVAAVAKAKGDPQVAVYTADGTLVGTVDPGDIAPIADAQAPAAKADETEDAAPAPAVADGEDAAVIPGTSTVAAPAPDEDAVTKAVQAGFNTALAEALKPLAEELQRTAGLADVVKGLQERVEHLATMPDDRKSPLLNGATGTAGIADRNGAAVDPLADLRKAVEDAAEPGAKRNAQAALAYAEIRSRFA